MRQWIMIAMLPMLASTAACQSKWEKEGASIPANGPGATRTYAATGFTGVELNGSDDADVKIGNNFSVTAEGDPKVLDRLQFEVVDGSLRISRKHHSGAWLDNDHGARIHIVMPKLTKAGVGGSGNLTVERGEGDFSGDVAGSGDLGIGDLKAGKTTLSIAGSGNITAKGVTDRLSASVAGSGDISALDLVANSGDVSIAGSGDVQGTIKGSASVSIVGSGDVDLRGGAKCSTTAVGSGEAHCS